MATYNFTVRAKDETGAFADRQFSIQVRNNLVDRLFAINGSHGYASVDGVNWTQRTGVGGQWCDNVLGRWIVVQNATTYRISGDTINWQEGLEFRLKNDPPVLSEDEFDPETEEPVVIEEAGELYNQPFTITGKPFKAINGKVYAIATVLDKTGLVESSDLVNWYLVVGEGYEDNHNNYFGISGLDNNAITWYSTLEIHNNQYVIYNQSLRGFIVSDDLKTFTTIIPNNGNVISAASESSNDRKYAFDIKSINGILFINSCNASRGNGFGSNRFRFNNRLYSYNTIDLLNITIPTNSAYVANAGFNNSNWHLSSGALYVPLRNANMFRNNIKYVNGNILTHGYFISQTSTNSLVKTNNFGGTSATPQIVFDIENYDGELFAITNSGTTMGVLRKFNTHNHSVITIEGITGLPSNGLISIATM